MRNTIFFAALFLLTATWMGCEKENIHIVPSTAVSSQEHAISSFADFTIEDPFEVYVTFAATAPTLRIEANENIQHLIKVKQNGDRLTVGLENNVSISGGPLVLKAYLTTNDLSSIQARGTASVYLQNTWQGQQLDVELDGASNLTGSISAQTLSADLTGASNLMIDGSTGTFNLRADGACHMEDLDFATNTLAAELEGACTATLTVHQQISVTATGGSTLYYQGDAT
ncbi:MAG: DUF2807 domain-containing protein, partial [Lewinella sp.]|nr:DUF2807 domain-containing protein [Lewinella sp.]